ncbi:MAG: hypothetical protein H0T68_14010 [Gemmatimonadales bacterium]|nr:hypothetical protein [Gemmatimonadales bacterium]
MTTAAHALIVVKLGGGLSAIPGALETASAGVSELARRWRVVVVPGGGPFADAVREFDRHLGLSDDAAHWMAILAMDQYGHVLAERIAGAVLVEEPGGIGAALGAGQVAVFAPYRWMRSADVLPHTWDATGDSVAAFVAGALDAAHLVLVKPGNGPAETAVDGCFAGVVPAGLPWTAIGWQRLGGLSALLLGDGHQGVGMK